MIISHKHKFIFIKTKKTAGTSLEIALSSICGSSDIITPISPEDEKTRQELGYREPQNWKINEQFFFYNHIGAAIIQKVLNPDMWNNYYKFCFERNPWDKVVSWYYWEHKAEPRPTISDFIASGHASQVGGPGGFDLYTVDGEVAVDRVCRYENMSEEIAYLQERLNLPEIPPMPRAKAKYRVDKRHYTDILSDADRSAIEKAFNREIRLMNYQF